MTWLPSLYFAKGLSYVVVMVLSLLLFRQTGQSLTVVTLLVACFYLPWVLKPLWRPRMASLMDSRTWVLLTEFLLVAGFAALALTVSTVVASFAILLAIAFLTAAHNVAADALFRHHAGAEPHRSYGYVREIARNLAFVVGQGVVVTMVGNLQVIYRYDIAFSWSLMFYVIAGIYLLLSLCHIFVLPSAERAVATPSPARTVLTLPVTCFLLFCGMTPAFQSKVVVLYLLEPLRRGGLGLSPQEYGLVAGSLGVFALAAGGLAGSRLLLRFGYSRLRWPMALSLLVPSIAYAILSVSALTNLWLVALCIVAEQLCCGFGMAPCLFLLRLLRSDAAKSLFALSMLVSTAVSGAVASATGYPLFFVISFAVGILGVIAVRFLRLPDRKIPPQQ